MSEDKVYPVAESFASQAHIDAAGYREMYQRSVDDPEGFWAEQADQFISWSRPWDTVLDWDFSKGYIRWFEGAELNVSYNCIDRHLDSRGDQVAIIWEGDNPAEDSRITYRELHRQVCTFANVLKARGVKKGDRVCIYMPMIPEAAYAMLACARIGAIHSVVFGGFSPESIKDRILDSDCQVVITADEGVRGGKNIPLKANTDKALESCPNVHTVLVTKRTGGNIQWHDGRDVWLHEISATVDADCPAEPMGAEDPLFILYTSGSTGKPKGVLHTSGGYLLFAAMTHKYVFDYQDGEHYWCTADVGWITGHTYILYGPLANGATTLMFEGIPTYPDASRFWQVCDKHQVATFYTAPTAIRALMREGDGPVKKHLPQFTAAAGHRGRTDQSGGLELVQHRRRQGQLPDCRYLVADRNRRSSDYAAAWRHKTEARFGEQPFFGVQPHSLMAKARCLKVTTEGNLVITHPWPGQMRTVYGDQQRFVDTYFSTYPGMYFTGDGARRDKDGYYWITGRVDDVLNVSGHRLGTAELESALVLHESVAEAAVVGYPARHQGPGHLRLCHIGGGSRAQRQTEDRTRQTGAH